MTTYDLFIVARTHLNFAFYIWMGNIRLWWNMEESGDCIVKGCLEKIDRQVGSNGKQGWPVAVKDRVAYSPDREGRQANVAVTFLWTMRDAVIPKLDKSNLAIATNFYTPAGLEGMIRNILGNPYVRFVVMFGEEYSSRSKDDRVSELTSANAIRAFFEKGIGDDRKLPGFESAVNFDKNIPTEMINSVRGSVELIDLNKKMPNTSLDEKIAEANRLLGSLEKKAPFMDEPKTYDFEQTADAFPFEGGPIVVHESTIPRAWVEMIHNIYRYGRPNLMNANTDRWVKEINDMTVVVHDPQNMDLSYNPFLVPISKEKIEAYKREILSSVLPEGKAYTYGNKLRAYMHSSAEDIKKLVNSEDYKDFEFGQGPHLDANVKYVENKEGTTIAEINQVQDIIDALKRDTYSKACVAITWHVQDELMRKHKSSPCLVFLQAIVQDERLNLTVFFRSHDMTQGWPENAYGCAAIQKEIADGIGVDCGLLVIMSGSGQIYRHYFQQVEDMLKKFRNPEDRFEDARGRFIIEVNGKESKIVARLVDPNTGKDLQRFDGASPKDVYKQIDHFLASMRPDHAMYLGTELQKAAMALKAGKKYEQDREPELN
jgi:thymidylate synthase